MSAPGASVLKLNGTDRVALALLLGRYGLQLTLVAPQEPIPASYWGESEAGLKGEQLYARLDTPVHSAAGCAREVRRRLTFVTPGC